MDAKERQNLITAMMKVIDRENLPKPERICIRTPVYGTKTTRGKCIKSIESKKYRIIISTIKAKFINDSQGKYRSKVDGEKYRRVMGDERTINEIIHISAHETAHLKYWDHGPQHESYTKHIEKLLCQELGVSFSN